MITNYFEGKENLSLQDLKDYRDKLLLEKPDELIEISIAFQEFLDSKNSKKDSYKIDVQRVKIGVATANSKNTKYLARLKDNELSIIILNESAMVSIIEENNNQFIEVEPLNNGKILFKI